MTQIERRQARLRKMKSKLIGSDTMKLGALGSDSTALSPQSHHHMGKSESEPEHIGTLLKKHQGDPAILV